MSLSTSPLALALLSGTDVAVVAIVVAGVLLVVLFGHGRTSVRLGSIEAKVDHVNHQVNNQPQGSATLQQKVDQTHGDLRELVTGQERVAGQLLEINRRLDEGNHRFERAEDRLVNIEASLYRVGPRGTVQGQGPQPHSG